MVIFSIKSCILSYLDIMMVILFILFGRCLDLIVNKKLLLVFIFMVV